MKPDRENRKSDSPERSSRFGTGVLGAILGFLAGIGVFLGLARREEEKAISEMAPEESQARPQGFQRRGARGYEKRDANAKWIFGVVVFLLVSGVSMHLVMSLVMGHLKKTPAPSDAWTGMAARQMRKTPIVQTSFPRLQIAPEKELKELRVREELELNTYGWINKTAGVVRIPIDRAMDLVLQRGLPTRSGTNGDRLGPSSFELQQQRPATAEQEIKGAK
ncbi:MAG TPA: hypothetical protein VFM25_02355 [Verrucomicrobiae bacterium]|nr:hypothetical protein [Verrucomicrobiae bacterium]